MSHDKRPVGPQPGDDPDHLTRTLQELPRVPASPTFTDRVLARIASDVDSKADLASSEPGSRTRTNRAALPALLAAAAAATGALVLTFGAADPPSAPQSQSLGPAGLGDGSDLHAMGAELDQLRREQRDLAAEVESLRAQESDQPATVIYVGQSAGVDLVLDLAHFQERGRPARPGGKP